MSTTNRVRVSSVREVTVGVTPTSPRMRLQRVTGVGLTAAPRFVDSQELRADRMVADSIETLLPSGGGSIPFEFSYPDANSPFADDIESAFYNTFVNTPTFFNDGTADSVITDAGTTTDTYAVTAGGTAVVVGHLVRATGFGNAANNQIFRAASSTGTTIVGSGLGLSAETAPAATAKLKVVGFQGASGDLVLTTTGMTSTLLNFTTLGLQVGQWLKIGGTVTASRYTATVATRVQRAIIVAGGTGGTPGAVTITGTTGTGTLFQATGTISAGGVLVGALTVTVGGQYTANPTNINIEPVTGGGLTGATVRLVMVNGNSNDWVRITAIAASTLTFDNLPPSWVTDTGAAKTIKVWFGDVIKNGTTQLTATKEIGFMDQEVPGYFQYIGLSVNTMSFSVTSNERITGTAAFTGRSMTPSNVSLDDTPDAATTGRIMAAHANVGRLSEAGRTLTEPNWGNALTFEINNNQRELLDIGSQSVAGVNPGFCTVTGTITLYMGDLSLYTKLINNVVTSLGSRWQKDNQACIFTFPHVTYRGGDPAVAGPNNDITLPLSFQAAADTLTNSEVMFSRVEYYEQ